MCIHVPIEYIHADTNAHFNARTPCTNKNTEMLTHEAKSTSQYIYKSRLKDGFKGMGGWVGFEFARNGWVAKVA